MTKSLAAGDVTAVTDGAGVAAPSPRPPLYPLLYQVNTRVWLRQRSDQLGRAATLDDIEEGELDRIAALGFDWVWFLGVWQTGAVGREISRTQPEWRRGFDALLPDLEERDIAGSCFALTGYTVPPALGGEWALQRLRQRLQRRKLRLMLDFVPNHMALDHPWVRERPDLFVQGSEDDRARAPGNYRRLDTAHGPRLLAHGRDPYFPGWPDTVQLDYGKPDTQAAMKAELRRVAERCDGVRCDMAMLILPEVFERTWGIAAAPFWPDAIAQIRQRQPDFLFMAEVYWDLEWTLQQQGFDVTYDKRLYDRLAAGAARPVRDHLRAGLDFQRKSARFLENHDEPRAAHTFSWEKHQPAAIITYLLPGLRFFHQGQLEGRQKFVPVHLCRAPAEAPDAAVQDFYARLLAVLGDTALRQGAWGLLEAAEAWPGNGTWDGFIAFAWAGPKRERVVVAVNYQPTRAQCYVRLPFPELADRAVQLRDLMGPARYDRAGSDLLGRGLYLDLPPWGYHVFTVAPTG